VGIGHCQVGKAPSWARAPIGAGSHDGFSIMHNIIFSADPKQAKMATVSVAGSSSFVAPWLLGSCSLIGHLSCSICCPSLDEHFWLLLVSVFYRLCCKRSKKIRSMGIAEQQSLKPLLMQLMQLAVGPTALLVMRATRGIKRLLSD